MTFDDPARRQALNLIWPRGLRAVAGLCALVGLAGACSGSSESESETGAPSAESSDTAEPVGSDESSQAEALDEDETPSSDAAGSGMLRLGDQTYTFDAESCQYVGGALLSGGLSNESGEYGAPWVSIDLSTVEDRDGDGEIDQFAEIRLEHGKVDLFGDTADGMPEFMATAGPFALSTVGPEEGTGPTVDFTVDGSSASGSGRMVDIHGISIAPGETVEFEFDVNCS